MQKEHCIRNKSINVLKDCVKINIKNIHNWSFYHIYSIIPSNGLPYHVKKDFLILFELVKEKLG